MIGTEGPTGTTGYRADPNQPGGYTQYTQYSPAEQQTYDLSKAAENSALGVANSQIGRVNTALSNSLDLNSLPSLQTGQTVAGNSNPLQYSFNPGQQVQGQVGGDLNQALTTAQNAAYNQATSRLDPMYQRQGNQLENKLANQGLSVNSEAYKNAQQQFNEGKNDAYNQAIYSSIGAGENAAQNLFGRQLNQGQFANQAAGQMYSQNQGQAQFNNQAVGQQFNQDSTAAQIANQQAALQNQARNQGLQEQAYVQNQPINQFNALMSSGQVSAPQGVQYQNTSVAPTDVLGAYALNQQAQQYNANAKNASSQGLLGGLFGLGSAAILASDVRLKRDIRLIGKMGEFPAYAFKYLWSPVEHIGVMAQDVMKTKPWAVVRMDNGFLAVNYGVL